MSENSEAVWDRTVTPRSLRRLYLRTREEIEDSVRAQVERSYDQMIEREQLTVGWNV